MIVGDVDTEAFINTMHQSQAEVEIATPGDIAMMWMLRHRQTSWLTFDKVCETLMDLKGTSLF